MDGRVVFRNVNLAIASGECLAILGDNGVGKTTLLRNLAGVLRPTSGTIRWHGNGHRKSSHVRAMLGYVGHTPQIYPYLTLHENLLFAARMHALDTPRQRAGDLLRYMGIDHAAHQRAGKGSRGTLQRLDIARAMVHGPSILLLDEPANSLDSQGRQWLLQSLATYRESGRTVCFTTHQESLVQQLADRVVRIEGKSLVEEPKIASARRAA